MPGIIKKSKQLFEDIVVASVGRDDAEAVRKASLMYSLALVGICILVILTVIALLQNAIILAVVDFITALFLISLLVFMRFGGNYIFCSYCGVIVMACLYLYVFVTGGVDSTGFVWYYTFPLIALFLLGTKAGTIATFILFIPAVFFLLLTAGQR